MVLNSGDSITIRRSGSCCIINNSSSSSRSVFSSVFFFIITKIKQFRLMDMILEFYFNTNKNEKLQQKESPTFLFPDFLSFVVNDNDQAVVALSSF